jgi:DNA-binding MarR family transcriptional regulator
MIATKSPSRPKPAEPPNETAVRALIRTYGLLERVQQPYFAQFGISGSQWGVLRALHRAEKEHPAGLRLTDLSARLLIRPPSVTGVVDRLQRAGLVVRGASSDDLRSKAVSLTPRGRQLVDQVLSGLRSRLSLLLGGLSATEQARLHRLLVRWGQHLEELARQDEPSNAQ